MTQSREALAMEFNRADSLTFGKSKGFYLSQCTIGLLVLIFVCANVAVGLLVYHFASCPSDNSGGGEIDGKGGGTSTPTTDATSKKVRDVRLPSHLVPDNYRVRLMPYIVDGNFTIDGEAWITMNCTSAGDNVTVHAFDMTIMNSSVEVTDLTSNTQLKVMGHSYDPDRQFYITKLESSLQPDRRYRIYIRYLGKLNERLSGFYRSSYTNQNNQTRWLGVTQFQPTDARRAFPCFDEPALKATFEVTLGRPDTMTSISNMPIKETRDVDGKPGWKWDVYEKSVPMSTYLVAFVVSDFASRSAEEGVSDTLFRVWARPEAIEQAEYARDVGPKILEHFERYFNVAFPLPKQDMIALPDFSAGAMENWGLITYRETAMLYEAGVSSASNKQRVAVVVSHELAHQWFGNLVTPSWWTDLWLNEGFASYVEYLGVDHVEPTWKMMEQIVTEDVQSVMDTDALESSHPISIVVGHPDEINEIFDRISYAKGASIIRMMDHYLTTDTFRKGLTNYLSDRSYQAAEQDDLWQFLTDQAHADGTLDSSTSVKEIMDTWTLQMGFPVVTVERDYDRRSFTLKQHRFLMLGKPKSTSGHEYLWWIPITWTSQSNPNFNNTRPSLWMKNERQVDVATDGPSSSEWMIVNIQEAGYYKVNYDRQNWELLIRQLTGDHLKIGTINRAMLVDDAMDLARSGQLGYDIALGITKYLDKEVEYTPWEAALNNLGYLSAMLRRSAGYGVLRRYILKLVTPLYDRVGFDDNSNDPLLQQYNRINALHWACGLDHEDCVTKAKDKFRQWMGNPDSQSIISPNLKSLVYCQGIKHGGEEEWDFAWQQFQKSNVASEKSKLMSALGCSQEIWILSRYLNWTLSADSGIRTQDGSKVFSAVGNNIVGRYLVFDFLRNYWPQLKARYGEGIFALNRFITPLHSSSYNTQLDLQELRDFYASHKNDLGSATRTMEQAIEKAEANVAWMDRNYDVIVKWLQENV